MATTHQQSDYQRAIARADAAGILIVGSGAYRVSGERFFLVSSASDESRPHIVRVSGAHLACDCTAAKHGRYCQHRAVAHRELERESADQQAWMERTRQQTDRDAEKRETAPLARRPFSIWAAS